MWEREPGGGIRRGARRTGADGRIDRPPDRRPRRGRHRARSVVAVALTGLLALSGWGTLVPATVRCALPGQVGCPGGFLGPALTATGTQSQWFAVTMWDYGFGIVNLISGANESGNWTIFEGFLVHVNATSLPPDASQGGTGAHALGLLMNGLTYTQSAPVGSWSNGSFYAPTGQQFGARVYCSLYCGSGHGGMFANTLNIVPAPPAPTAQLQLTPTSGNVPLNVTASASATGGSPPYRFLWTFGDGGRAVGANQSHQYLLPGLYLVVVTATDAAGLSGSANVTVTARGAPTLAVDATGSPTTGPAPLLVYLNASASSGNAPYRFSWTFGDGGSAPGANVSHTYLIGGLFFATVEVLDSSGRSASASVPVRVTSATSGPLRVFATVSPTSGDLPLSVNATASVSGGTGTYLPVRWDWGDGTNLSTGPVANHTFRLVDPGRVEVVALALDSQGNWTQTNLSVDLFAPGSGTLVAAPAVGPAPLSVALSVRWSGGNGSFAPTLWNFGDGTTGSGAPSTTHVYDAEGTFPVTASTTDSAGRTLIAQTTVTVTTGAPGTGPVVTSGPVTPLLFLGTVALLGLVLLGAAALWERRYGFEPEENEGPGGSGDA